MDDWCEKNYMAINSSKTKVMYVASNHKVKQINDDPPVIHFRNETLECSQEEKLLGVTIDDVLSWNTHVNNVLKKCNSLLYLLSRIKVFLTLPMRKLFYNSYILPHFDYCCTIWGNCSNSLEAKLVTFQKRAARLILDKDFDTPSVELFQQLKWMTFPQRVIFQKAVLMYKSLNDQAPIYLRNAFTFTSDVHTQNLRSSSNLQLYPPRPNCELFKKSFTYSGVAIWNALPNYIKLASSVNHFKSLYIPWSRLQQQ